MTTCFWVEYVREILAHKRLFLVVSQLVAAIKNKKLNRCMDAVLECASHACAFIFAFAQAVKLSINNSCFAANQQESESSSTACAIQKVQKIGFWGKPVLEV